MQFLQCPREARGNFIYPFDCSRYVKCENGQTTIVICGEGNYFSKTHKMCKVKDQVPKKDRVDFYWDNVYGMYINQ